MEVTVENIVDNFDRIFDSGDEIELEDLEFEEVVEEREPVLDAHCKFLTGVVDLARKV